MRRASFNVLLVFVVGLFIRPEASAQDPFQVNVFADSTQREPHVALSSNADRMAISWMSIHQDGDGEGVFFRLFDASGVPMTSDIQVSEQSGGIQFRPSVAISDNGVSMVVWSEVAGDDMLDVRGRLYDAAGLPVGASFILSNTTAETQSAPDVAVVGTGFCATWHSWEQDGGDRAVFMRCFGPDGTPVFDESQVNTTTAYSQAHPAIAALSTGKLVVVWSSWTDDGGGRWSYDVYARELTDSGAPVSDEWRVNTVTAENQWHADVDGLPNGEYMVTWTSWNEDGDGGGIYARRVSGGSPAAPFRVNDVTAEYQWMSSVALSASGAALITWSSFGQDGDRDGVYYKEYDAEDNATTSETRISDYQAGYQWEPRVAWDESTVAIAWSSWMEDGSDYGVMMRLFSASSIAADRPESVIGSDVRMAPNPFASNVTISMPTAGHVVVVDVLGRRVAEWNVLPGHVIVWDGTGRGGHAIAPGTYIVHIRSTDGRAQISKPLIRYRP